MAKRITNAATYVAVCLAACLLGIIVSLGLLAQAPLGAYRVFKEEAEYD
jgi:hypothetical protein